MQSYAHTMFGWHFALLEVRLTQVLARNLLAGAAQHEHARVGVARRQLPHGRVAQQHHVSPHLQHTAVMAAVTAVALAAVAAAAEAAAANKACGRGSWGVAAAGQWWCVRCLAGKHEQAYGSASPQHLQPNARVSDSKYLYAELFAELGGLGGLGAAAAIGDKDEGHARRRQSPQRRPRPRQLLSASHQHAVYVEGLWCSSRAAVCARGGDRTHITNRMSSEAVLQLD
jgi:uncharacterized membrane protein